MILEPGGDEITQFSFNVMCLNLADKNDPDDYARRLANVARKVKSDALHPWEFIGLSECYAQRVASDDEGLHYHKQKIRCELSGEQCFTAPCFAATLCDGSSIGPYQDQFGECGIIVGGKNWKPVGETMQVLIGSMVDSLAGHVRRPIIGQKFCHQPTGYVLPFISIHLTGEDTTEMKDMISSIKRFWTPGDLLPVVVGDFNSQSWDEDRKDRMKKNFDSAVGEAESNNMRIYVGKPDRFKGSSGHLLASGQEELRDYFSKPLKDYTDHAAAWTTLTGPGGRYLGNINTHEVHDLDNQNYKFDICQTKAIIINQHARMFDTLEAAHLAGYDNCAYCIGDSHH